MKTAAVKRILAWALAALAGVVPAAKAGSLHPNSQSGVAIDQSFGGGALDHINLFNGGLTVTLPIGPRFAVSDRLSYGFTLVGTSSPWHFSQEEAEDTTTYTSAIPSPCGNVALGWRLSFGEIIPATLQVIGCMEASPFPIYDAPDGSSHRFYPTPVEGGVPDGAFYSREGSHLRLRANVGGWAYLLEFPDGTMHRFDSAGQLGRMEDRFGNQVTIARAGGQWTITDPWRSSTVTFGANAVTLDLPAFNGGRATYTLTKATRPIPRGCTVFGRPSNTPESPTVAVSLLTGVQLPDASSFGMDYHESPASCMTSGSLAGLNLRTGGRIEWQYGNYSFPTTSAPKIHRQNNLGVTLRTLKDRNGVLTDPLCVGGGQRCSWTYAQTPANAQSIESITTVTDPYGSVVKSYFSAATNPFNGVGDVNEYGAPISRARPAQTAQRPAPTPENPQQTAPIPVYLSTEVFDKAGALLRQEYLSFDHDPAPAYTAGSVGVDAANENRRVQQSRTVFLDDGGRYVDTAYTGYDGAGHYRTATTTDTFGFSTQHSETTNWNPNGLPGVGAPWILTNYDFMEQREGAAVERQEAVFEPGTGFLTCARRLKSGTRPGPHDVVVTYGHADPSAPGRVSVESWYGGDAQRFTGSCSAPGVGPAYTYNHSYAYGIRKQTTVRIDEGGGQGHDEFLLDLDIDPNTGLAIRSRDAAGQASSFGYDALNRVVSTTPAGLATTSTTYQINAPQGPLITSVVAGELERETWTLDAFGRVGENAVTLPGPLTTQTGVVNGFGVPSRTFALYNPMGWKTFVSEASAGGSAFGSTYLYHRPNDPRGAVPDPFGRPAEILAADGKKTQLAYEGARVVRRSQRVQQQVQTRNGAATVWSTAEVWASTVELHDGLGRLREVKDPNGTRTTYAYDPGGRLITITTRSGNKAQTRTFSYDGRGFLFRESPAESGAITYRYDARGNAMSKGTPTGTVFFSYDAAGRLTKMSTPDGKLREHVYGKVGALTGKLITSKAYNYRATGICTEYMVQEDYHYDASGGRLSAVDTTLFQSGSQQEKWTQSYDYDGAGKVTQIRYPSCLTGCAAASRSVSTTYAYGRPTSIQGFANAIAYSENGTLSKIEHANGVVFTSGLDPKGIARPGSLRADRATASGAAPVWPQESYAFDGAGNIKQIGAKSFTYDNLSRLTSATLPTASGQPYQEYAYDAFGNLTRLYSGTSKGNVTYVDYQTSTATNQLTGASYNGSGSMTAYQGTAYTWDVLQQLAKVDATAAGSEAWTHVYDAAGERVWSWRTSSTRVDTFALRGPGGKVLSLFTKIPGSPAPTYSWKDYVYRGGQLLGAKLPDGTVRHFDVDHLGTVRLETDAEGTVAYRELWPYGEEATPLAGDERMKFTGHERDLGVLASTADDLDYMHSRYYRPLIGRFLSMDSQRGHARAPQSWNRYAYVLGQPTRLIDPNGEEPLDPAIRSYLESYFLQDLAGVQVHGGFFARVLSFRALAITYGNHLYFGREGWRQYKSVHRAGADTETVISGIALAGHEVAHTLQYRKFGFFPFLFRYTWAWARAGFNYRDNPFEIAAFAIGADITERLGKDPGLLRSIQGGGSVTVGQGQSASGWSIVTSISEGPIGGQSSLFDFGGELWVDGLNLTGVLNASR